MHWEQVNEAVKVRADFQGGAISPLLIKRGEKTVRVRGVNTRWIDTQGRHRLCYFSVTTDSGDIYQLRFHGGEMTWLLEYVMFEG
ncbi:MAG: hypothetical protein KJ970_10775 [Candidatus Eisenbacteria bacterium]|uniref:Uncharacterized protein n=1 Tax=Eiseniibacteriota bacterium TaxID=2212470 RepID=A0A948RUT4_UNCEI|nr:hypothetical protein [Candidatus Eisenbacteria bacterium]MBU1950205.1 hypothetical protein [Candidatus Eisenbacteria bacterium]MBU2691398.1 hypothetical protein [Candidatus Eisenbacteria bacterium]